MMRTTAGEKCLLQSQFSLFKQAFYHHKVSLTLKLETILPILPGRFKLLQLNL